MGNIVFTRHAEERMKKRLITRKEAVEGIQFPEKITKKFGKYYCQKTLERGKIEVVTERTEKNIKVITLYWM